MFIHNLDPFIFDFGFFAIRWYSLAYILGILIGWWYGKNIDFQKTLAKNVMTKNPITITSDSLAIKALRIMNEKKITSLCVVNGKNSNKTTGLIHIHHILEANIE